MKSLKVLLTTTFISAFAVASYQAVSFYENFSKKIYISAPIEPIQNLQRNINESFAYKVSKPSDRSAFIKLEKEMKNEQRVLLSSIKEFKKSFKKYSRNKIVATKDTKRFERVSYSKYEINNSELIQLTGIEARKFNQTISWSKWYSSQKIEKKLLAIEEPTIKDLDKEVVDKVDMRLAASIVDSQEVPALEATEEKFINELVNSITSTQIEKIKKEVKKKDKKEVNDELVFFDYSEDTPKEDIEIDKLSKTVLKKIDKDVKKFNISTSNIPLSKAVKKVPVTKMDSQKTNPARRNKFESVLTKTKVDEPVKVSMTSQNSVDIINPGNKSLSSQKQAKTSNNFQKDNKEDFLSLLSSQKQKKKSKYKKDDIVAMANIVGLEVDLKTRSTSRAIGYEFIPHFSNLERYSDDDGIIEIEEKLNSSHGILRGTLVKRGIVPTNVDVVLEDGEFELEVPLLSISGLDNLLTKHSIRAFGGFIMVDLHEEVDTVDIDSKYEDKFYFDEKFREVGLDGDYRYILFAGVEPGNTLIQYVTFKDEEAEKIIHVTEDEIYFEANFFNKAKKEVFELYENKVLGSKKSELNIESEKLKYFNTNIESNALSINAYEMNRPMIPIGTRKYYELSHLEDSIFIGNWDSKVVEVPSMDFISYVMDAQGYSSLDNRCMIQINYSKMIVDVQTFGQTLKGPMNVEMIHLDNDGLFGEYDEPTDLTKKSFIFGDFEGIVSLKVQYIDDSVDYIQTYCSNNTYLVEQL